MYIQKNTIQSATTNLSIKCLHFDASSLQVGELNELKLLQVAYSRLADLRQLSFPRATQNVGDSLVQGLPWSIDLFRHTHTMFTTPSARVSSQLMCPMRCTGHATRNFSVSHRFSADPPAASVATSFFARFQSLGPQTRTQTLDANQLQLLTLTLNRPSLFPGSPSLSNTPTAPPLDTPVPPGYHLVYFTPAFLESELGLDGTDASYNPESPFTRRMWAGGEVVWPRDADGEPNPLRVGQQVSETTRVLSAEPKVVKKTGEDMIVVGVEKEFANEHGVSIVDRRSVLLAQLDMDRALT